MLKHLVFLATLCITGVAAAKTPGVSAEKPFGQRKPVLERLDRSGNPAKLARRIPLKEIGQIERKNYDVLNALLTGQPALPPESLMSAASFVYGKLLPNTAANSRPRLIFDDCGSPRASVNAVMDIELCREVFRRVQTEDELAFLLAHELAHLILDHQVRVADQQSLGVDLATTMAYTTGLRRIGSRNLPPQPRWSYRVGRSEQAFDQRAYLYAQAQELEADYLAIDMMTAAGYTPDGAYTWIDRTNASSAEEPSAIGNAHPPVSRRLEFVLHYIEKFHSEADLRSQTAVRWSSAPSPEEKTYLEALAMLSEASIEFAVARHYESEINAAARQRIYGPTTTAWDNRVLFCASAKSKLARLLNGPLDGDRKAGELATALDVTCIGKNFTSSALARSEATRTDGLWRYINIALTTARYGLDDDRRKADQIIANIERQYGDVLGVLGSVFTWGNMIGDERFQDTPYRVCRRNLGQPLGAMYENDCVNYFNALIIQGINNAERFNLVYAGQSEDLYTKFVLPAFNITIGKETSVDPRDHNLTSWQEGAAASTAWVLPPSLTVYSGPSSQSGAIGQLNRGDDAYQTGIRMDGYHQISFNGRKGWVEGRRLFRYNDFEGADWHQSRLDLGLSVSGAVPEKMTVERRDEIFRTGVHQVRF